MQQNGADTPGAEPPGSKNSTARKRTARKGGQTNSDVKLCDMIVQINQLTDLQLIDC